MHALQARENARGQARMQADEQQRRELQQTGANPSEFFIKQQKLAEFEQERKSVPNLILCNKSLCFVFFQKVLSSNDI